MQIIDITDEIDAHAVVLNNVAAEGLGFNVYASDTAVVVSVVQSHGAASHVSNLKVGDQIVAINDTSIRGMHRGARA